MTKSTGIPCTPGLAYWNQRFAIRDARQRLLAFARATEHAMDLTPFQYTQLYALALEFRPDLILELGRGFGNSTCLFTEAANQLHDPCRVVSLGDCDNWNVTVDRLRGVVEENWFAPLEALRADICTFDYDSILAGAERVMIFWDAHGFEVAEAVLGRILPRVADKEHFVALHDMSDLRYAGEPDPEGNYALWKGSADGAGRFCLGGFHSQVPQAISVLDFTYRNRLTFDSADHSIDMTIGADPAKVAEMQELLGEDMFSIAAGWYWFTLNEHPGPYKFPRS
jgi:hypothetical protein